MFHSQDQGILRTPLWPSTKAGWPPGPHLPPTHATSKGLTTPNCVSLSFPPLEVQKLADLVILSPPPSLSLLPPQLSNHQVLPFPAAHSHPVGLRVPPAEPWNSRVSGDCSGVWKGVVISRCTYLNIPLDSLLARRGTAGRGPVRAEFSKVQGQAGALLAHF